MGQEKILVEVFQEIGLTGAEISSFLSGPAFQAWNRFGNIQGSWGGDLPMSWINGQFKLQKQIVARMVELGMTPVLPAFTGFVPRGITRVQPNAMVVNGSNWNNFPTTYTNDTFLEPADPLFSHLQQSFISKQIAAYGDVTNIYTLDQYNENNPYSGDTSYLRNVTYNTWLSLKAANPSAIWLMQSWLFFVKSDFWTNDRVEAYLGGVENPQDMLILDLFSEAQPQWQRTNSYFGKPWIWCQLHDFGGNMGLYGQIENITINPIEALANSSSLVGFGLTMESQEGNEIVYDLLLDQAWSASPIDTETYFHNWVTRRYAGNNSIPLELYQSWDIMHSTIYNNTKFNLAEAVASSIFELSPSITGLSDRTGNVPSKLYYQQSDLLNAWTNLTKAGDIDGALYSNPAYSYDLVDVTRQVLSNIFDTLYANLIATYTSNSTASNSTSIQAQATTMLKLLSDLDTLLLTNPNFALATWLEAARACSNVTSEQDLYEYDARNQITLWGPTGQISDYAAKAWGGLVSSYYAPRWSIFFDYIGNTTAAAYNQTEVGEQLMAFELGWQNQTGGTHGVVQVGGGVGLEEAVAQAKTWVPGSGR